MTFNDDPDDQDKRIEKLRQELESLGGSTTSYESMPADMEEEFLRHVLEYETAEPISLFRLLENSCVEIPAAETLNWTSPSTYDFDRPLYSGGSKLREVVTKMAGLGAYLLHTNHLSDRELYEYLYNYGLREEAVLFPENPSYAYMIDLTGNGSDEDNLIYLKYYADDEHRKQWARDWPGDPMPPHEDPPFNRDLSLPQSPLG